MRVLVFDQWDRLLALVRNVAAGSATDRARYDIVRVEPGDGLVRLSDRAVNCLAVGGGRTTVAMPDMVPGKARDFMLRVAATGENEIAFAGAEAFEGDDGALAPPADGETVVYFFTETAADVMLVARRVAARIGT